MPAVVATLQSLLDSAPADVGKQVAAELRQHRVLPDYAADDAGFQLALKRCLAIVQRCPDQKTALVVRNTFVHYVVEDEEDEDEEGGVSLQDYRSVSDPTTSGLQSWQAHHQVLELQRLNRVPEQPPQQAEQPPLEASTATSGVVVSDSASTSTVSTAAAATSSAAVSTSASAPTPAPTLAPAPALPSLPAVTRLPVGDKGKAAAKMLASSSGASAVAGVSAATGNGRRPEAVPPKRSTGGSVPSGTSAWAKPLILPSSAPKAEAKPAEAQTSGWGSGGAKLPMAKAEAKSKKVQAKSATPAIIVKNTFVDVLPGSDDEEEETDSDMDDALPRTVSDPTGSSSMVAKLRSQLGPLTTAMGTARLSPKASDVPATLSLPRTDHMWVSFTDQEGDMTTLRAAATPGLLEMWINTEKQDDIRELEISYNGSGQFVVYMEGIGAVLVDPPPGPRQHLLCQELISLARERQVPCRGREGQADVMALLSQDATAIMAAGAVATGSVQVADPTALMDDFGYGGEYGGVDGYGGGWDAFCGSWPYGDFGDGGGGLLYDPTGGVYEACTGETNDAAESSSATATPSAKVPKSGRPPFGYTHFFHPEVATMGKVSKDFREFTKVGYEGRLSVITERQVHTGGLHRYLVQFSSGELSKADGVGFIFSPRLPCKKNIQRIVSIFVNQRGRICMRVYQDVIRASAHVRSLKIGDWVEMAMDLDLHCVSFTIWSAAGEQKTPTAKFTFASRLADFYKEDPSREAHNLELGTGHLAIVAKNIGVCVSVGS
eukprot:TRINITY_DN74232_c0_g1_i1.p1 TRINITY_DN74232_c0_g1~~TRINITY_DN74232_c0_g1_i1.p1  ORF type:complete len:832 (-),score=178.82 TRINITY_DN74232_c0_g1_i1:25-2349(-)